MASSQSQATTSAYWNPSLWEKLQGVVDVKSSGGFSESLYSLMKGEEKKNSTYA